jgi:lipopolysaccharide export system protein LptA
VAVFQGNVVVTDPQLTLKARTLTVLFDKQNQIRSLRAIGDVRMAQPAMDRRGSSDVVLYIAAKSQVTLINNAVLQKGKNQVRGDRITFVLDKETVLVEPAELVIFPTEKEDTTAP